MSPEVYTALQELKTTVITHGGSVLLIAIGSALMFIFGRIRDAMFVSAQNRLKKMSRLRPGTALGHQTINQELHDLRRDLDVTRVCIHQFHNGDNFMMSNHSWKVSCTHESLDPVARPTFKESQSLPISHMTDLVGPVVEPDLGIEGVTLWARTDDRTRHVVFYDLEAMDISAAKLQVTEQGTWFVVAVNLVDPAKRATFGFLSLHLQACDEEKIATLKEHIPDLYETAGRIQFHLSDDFRAFDRPGLLRRLWKIIVG